jgi:hypothetical protein
MLTREEYMAFGNIDRGSILHHIPIADIINLYDHDKGVAELLSLHLFAKNRRTKDVALELRERNITINPSSAAAMGRFAATMFGTGKGVSLHHISEMVARVVDGGWCLVEDTPLGYDCALAFALALDSDVYDKRDVANAFLVGIKKGNDVVRFYSRKPRAGTRRRNT